MRLAEVKIHGFRKLVETSCRFTGKLTAVVGPNEAGKSTLLEALISCQNGDEIPATARPRGREVADEDTALEVRYRLDDADQAAIEREVNASEVPRYYVVLKHYNGERQHWTEPELAREPKTRIKAHAALSRFAKTKASAYLDRNEELDGEGDDFDDAMSIASRVNDPSEKETSVLGQVIEHLSSEEATATARKAANALSAWVDECETEHPHDVARRILDLREPTFATFDEPQRNLSSAYSLSAEAQELSPALENLAALAGIDILALFAAYKNDDPGAAETATEEANDRLKQTLNVAWKQSDVEVHLRQDGGSLRLLVRTDSPRFSTVAERSDGLKTFVALTAFAHRTAKVGRPLVLLIDEAEQHLHYDAQADLVRMLDRQSLATQVIYTTHSAGCLPFDLGTGVRAVVPQPEQGRSQVMNSFWQTGPGFSPLLMALGASAAAFAPSRYAVIAEGATEMLLLPSMIREALGGVERLDYQVAHGLAEVGNGALRDLELEAPRVAYLVDGDGGGMQHARRLTAAGVPPSQIVSLGGMNSGTALEDLLCADMYLLGVNEVLQQLGGKALPKAALNASLSRPSAVAKWCNSRGQSVPGKPSVALAVIDILDRAVAKGERPPQLLTPNGRRALTDVHRQINAAFDITT